MRQGDGKGAPLPRVAFHPDPPTVQLRQVPGYGQPQPQPLIAPGQMPLQLAEGLEYLRLPGWGDADAGIRDFQEQQLGGMGYRYPDRSACGRELDGVTQQDH